MNINNSNDLYQALTEHIERFSSEMRGRYEDGSQTPATEADINELSRATCYALLAFRDTIVKYAKEQENK